MTNGSVRLRLSSALRTNSAEHGRIGACKQDQQGHCFCHLHKVAKKRNAAKCIPKRRRINKIIAP